MGGWGRVGGGGGGEAGVKMWCKKASNTHFSFGQSSKRQARCKRSFLLSTSVIIDLTLSLQDSACCSTGGGRRNRGLDASSSNCM